MLWYQYRYMGISYTAMVSVQVCGCIIHAMVSVQVYGYIIPAMVSVQVCGCIIHCYGISTGIWVYHTLLWYQYRYMGISYMLWYQYKYVGVSYTAMVSVQVYGYIIHCYGINTGVWVYHTLCYGISTSIWVSYNITLMTFTNHDVES